MSRRAVLGAAALVAIALLAAGCNPSPQERIRVDRQERYEQCVQAGGQWSYSSGAWGQEREACALPQG